MFKQMCAIEIRQPMSIRREVRRHPIENYPYAVLMQVIHQVHEILWLAVACRGREVAGRLISPRAVEGMLHHRQELDVGEPHTRCVIRSGEGPVRGSVKCRLFSSGTRIQEPRWTS